VRFYGRISYSFYLVNPLTLLVLWHIPDLLGSIVLRAGGFAFVVALMLFGVSVAVTTPVAWVMYEFVERPGVSFRKKFAPDGRTASEIGTAERR
jgi:peptidoglycan/LPS O-acetylase OafA/YrhL